MNWCKTIVFIKKRKLKFWLVFAQFFISSWMKKGTSRVEVKNLQLQLGSDSSLLCSVWIYLLLSGIWLIISWLINYLILSFWFCLLVQIIIFHVTFKPSNRLWKYQTKNGHNLNLNTRQNHKLRYFLSQLTINKIPNGGKQSYTFNDFKRLLFNFISSESLIGKHRDWWTIVMWFDLLKGYHS